ncbi:MAG TPA: NAD(P)H-binding protein [Symbiobacteriaceae bacterium]|nr:NAD(P)H-binding protein [Symbiobacteriaceae bacterium]
MTTAMVGGATGLVGGELLNLLLEQPEYERVVALVRRPLSRSHPKLAQAVVDFDRLEEQAEAFRVDDVYCCLGTTIKKAGSQAAQRRVDFEYPLTMARLAAGAGARRYLLVSSIGADTKSAIFYCRLKGEVEAAVAAAGVPAIHIFRPALLLGHRQEHRPGERIAVALSPLYAPFLPARYRPIAARDVAQAMVNVALGADEAGTRIYLNDEVQRLARR